MSKIKLLTFSVSTIISLLLIITTNSGARSFPFRSVNPGDELPAVNLNNSESGEVFALDSSNGKRSVIIFWNAEGASKKKRTTEALKMVADLQEFLNNKKVSIFIVTTGNDTPETISEVMSSAELSSTVYVDSEKNAYSGFGIFVMPSIMLVDDQGNVSSGLGYSRDLKKRLKGEVEIMLGEKTREQFEKELRPETSEKSATEKNSKRHFHLGETMTQRGQLEVAVKEFKKALELNPEMTEANIKLGCLYLELDKKELAKENLSKGLAGNPDSVSGQICAARINADEGELDLAADDLQFLLLRNARNPTLHYTLALIQEKKGQLENAIKEYRIAYELLVKKEMHK